MPANSSCTAPSQGRPLTKPRLGAVIVLMLIALAITGCSAPARHEFTQIHMGVACRITIDDVDAAKATSAARAAFARIAALDTALSDYRIDNDLARVNAAAGGTPVPIGPDLHAALVLARDLAAKTDGAFDPTIGPAVQLWRASRRTGTLPDETTRARTADLVNWRQLELAATDDNAFTARLARPGMRLDLGGIGKGIACDEAAAVLRAAGTTRFLISFGGELLAGDPPRRERRGWRIAQPGPSSAPNAPPEFLMNSALSTSGDAEQFIIIAGTRYSHIVDPRTGLGLTSSTQARVRHNSSAIADALATALCVLGRGAAPALEKFPEAQAWIDFAAVQHSLRSIPP